MINPAQQHKISDELRNFSLTQNDLSHRVIVISGATGGLGTVLSQACARSGATVVLLGRKLSKLEALYDSIEKIDGAAQPAIITLDQETSPETSYQQLGEMLAGEFGKIDALVHTAADVGVLSPLTQIKQADWARVMSINLTSVRLLNNACLPLLNKSDSASITFTADDKNSAYWGAYGVSKAALLQLAHMLFDETENQRHADGAPKIAVNAINPGPMRTALRRKAFPGELESETATPDTCIGPYLALIARHDRQLNGVLLNPSD